MAGVTVLELARTLTADDVASRTEYGEQPIARALLVLHEGLSAMLEEDEKVRINRFEATRVTSVAALHSRIRHLLARAYHVAECDLDERGEPVRF